MFKNDNFVKILETPNHSLLQIEAQKDKSIKSLKKWVQNNHKLLQEKIALHGGIFFKGFNINNALDFEIVAKAIDPNLCDKHPFDSGARTWLTKYIYEASISLINQSLIPISFHNEDSYISCVPSTIMFCSLEPALWGGESLIADCRKVFSALPCKLKKKFINKDVQSKFVFNDDIFLVNSRISKNKNDIIELGKAYGAEEVLRTFEDATQFLFKVPAVIKCNSSKDPVLFNLFHQTAISYIIDIWFAYSYKKGFLSKVNGYFLIILSLIKGLKLFIKSLIKRKQMDSEIFSPSKRIEYSLLDGENISLLELIQINLAFWKNAVILPLQKGDFIVLDNRLVAHGRMPYKGRRVLLSCIGSPTMVTRY